MDLVPDPGCPGGAHPPGPFTNPASVSTDPHGDIYVASAGPKEAFGAIDPTGGHVDVFDPSGHFLTELAVPGARVIAVDSSGFLYVGTFCVGGLSCARADFLRFDPKRYVPEAGEIEYSDPPIEVPQPINEVDHESVPITGLAINPMNQHLFANTGREVMEFGPPVSGQPNEKIEEGIGGSVLSRAHSVAIDAAHNLLYISDVSDAFSQVSTVRVLELEPPHALVRTIDGSTTPQGKFITTGGELSIAPDEATGNVFISDIVQGRRLYEFEEDGSYVATFPRKFESLINYIHVDNSPDSQNRDYVFVPSGTSAPGHAFAYQPKTPSHPPTVEGVSVSGLGEREAVAQAVVNPEGSPTHYVFEYTSQESFEEHGFSAALIAGEGEIASGLAGVIVSAPLSGLSPGTTYRFRVLAESDCQPQACSVERVGAFTTFAASIQGGTCGNTGLKAGPSAALPDCRAYELVSPSNTNGHPPVGPASFSGPNFGTAPIREDGNAITFRTEGGPIPGTNGTGSFSGDSYLATRTPSGWRIDSQGPTGEQNPNPSPGGLSPDLDYIAWHFGGDLGGPVNANYIRYPDGTFHLLGDGTLANDLLPELKYISPGGSHIIFQSSARLESTAPPGHIAAIYDRTSDGVLRVVSLLPGDVTPTESAIYEGRSDSGSSIAFKVGGGSPLYVRVDDSETLVAAPAGAAFAGFSADGRYLFYVASGDFFRLDTLTRETVEIAGSGDAEPVNIPADGTGAYFISLKKLSNAMNPAGAKALAGHPNLYHWDGTQNQFVGTLTPEDVEGEPDLAGGNDKAGGFDEWMNGVGIGRLGLDPARTDADGSTLLFRSHAQLTGDVTEGHAEIYRYSADEETLNCLSCNQAGTSGGSDAKLATFTERSPVNRFGFALVANLSQDGERAFFESSDRLVAADNDGLQDVYEWEAEGKGSCRQAGGCRFLISSGLSGRANYLYGASASGDDVAFISSDLLTADDSDETASIFDARVEGGFPASSSPSSECLGEACQPAAVAPPVVTPASSIFKGAGNVAERDKACPKGSHRRRVHGKSRCVKRRKHHSKRHHRTTTNTKGGSAR